MKTIGDLLNWIAKRGPKQKPAAPPGGQQPEPPRQPLKPLGMYLGDEEIWAPGDSNEDIHRKVGDALKPAGEPPAAPPAQKKPLVPIGFYLGKTKIWEPGISDEELDRRVHQAHEELERERESAAAKPEEDPSDKEPK